MFRRIFTALCALVLLMSANPTAWAVTPADWSMEHPEIFEAGHLFSEAAIMIDADSGEVLFEKNAHARMYPASTTKVMTLLLALESGISLDEEIIIPPEAGDVPEGSSVVPVLPGEKMPFRDLLYGFMMKSGNDGSNAIAVLVSGSIQAFVREMNQRAAEIGCADTNFVNAHGYHDENHYSTAADLAKIARVAMRNETFRQIVSTATYTMSGTSQREPLQITTRNALVNPDSGYYYPDAVGIKTGFHSAAGQCLVGAAERNGKLLISVVLKSDSQNDTLKWYDTARMLEYGYTQYRQYTFEELWAHAPEGLTTIEVANADASDPLGGGLEMQMTGLTGGSSTFMVRDTAESAAALVEQIWQDADIQLRSNLSAPIAAGDTLGNFLYTTENGEQIAAALTASRDVAQQPAEPLAPAGAEQKGMSMTARVFMWIGILIAVLAVLIAAMRIRVLVRRNRRRKAAAARRRNGYGYSSQPPRRETYDRMPPRRANDRKRM